MPEVVANTSPLQYLYQDGFLDLLQTLYGDIQVPPAVRNELARGLEFGVDLPRIETLDWVSVMAPETRVLLPLASGLGAGELQVIALCRETPNHLALLDDRRPRRFADLLSVTYSGTLGVLLKAKVAGHIKLVAPICNALEVLGFRLSPRARRALLELAEE